LANAKGEGNSAARIHGRGERRRTGKSGLSREAYGATINKYGIGSGLKKPGTRLHAIPEEGVEAGGRGKVKMCCPRG